MPTTFLGLEELGMPPGGEILRQGLGFLALLVLSTAPLPLIVYLLRRGGAGVASAHPVTHHLLTGLTLWTVIQCALVSALGWAGGLRLSWMVLLAAILLGSGLWLTPLGRTARRAWLEPAIRQAKALGEYGRLDQILIAIVAGMACLLAAQLVVFPIADIDSLTYQLPRVVQWYQSEGFHDPMPQHGSLINSYPFAWNTLFLVAVAPMGHDQFILIFNIVAWLMLGLATHRLARLCGGTRTASMAAATLALMMPASVRLVRTAHIDLAFAAFFLATVYFLLHAQLQKDHSSALIGVACGGMMLGTKTSGVPYAALLCVLSAWLLVQRRRGRVRGGHWRQGAIPLLVVGMAGVLTGLSWYIHNVVVTGNPLGPVRVAILGTILWDGAVTTALVKSDSFLHNFRATDPRHWSIVWSAVVAQLSLPGLALVGGSVALPWALWRQARHRGALLTVAGLCVACLFLYVSTPWSGRFRGEPGLSPFMGQGVRYGLPFLGLLAVLAGASCRWAPSWAFGSIVMAGCAAGIVASADPWGRVPAPLKWQVAMVAIAMVLAFAARWLGHSDVTRGSNYGRQGRAGRVGVFVMIPVLLFGLGLATTIGALRFRHRIQDRMFGGIVRFVDEELPRKARLGFWGQYPAYVLYGKYLRRPLHFIDLQNANTAEELVRALEETGVEVIAVGPRVEAWASASAPAWSLLAEREDYFERIQGQDVTTDVIVYRPRR